MSGTLWFDGAALLPQMTLNADADVETFSDVHGLGSTILMQAVDAISAAVLTNVIQASGSNMMRELRLYCSDGCKYTLRMRGLTTSALTPIPPAQHLYPHP